MKTLEIKTKDELFLSYRSDEECEFFIKVKKDGKWLKSVPLYSSYKFQMFQSSLTGHIKIEYEGDIEFNLSLLRPYKL